VHFCHARNVFKTSVSERFPSLFLSFFHSPSLLFFPLPFSANLDGFKLFLVFTTHSGLGNLLLGGAANWGFGNQKRKVSKWDLASDIHKEGWAPKNLCFQAVVSEKTPESPLDSKKIQPVNPKGHLPRIFIGRTDAEAEAPILWPPDVKSWLIGKDLDAGKDWGQEEKRATEDEMVGWHHRLDGHEFEQTPGDSPSNEYTGLISFRVD